MLTWAHTLHSLPSRCFLKRQKKCIELGKISSGTGEEGSSRNSELVGEIVYLGPGEKGRSAGWDTCVRVGPGKADVPAPTSAETQNWQQQCQLCGWAFSSFLAKADFPSTTVGIIRQDPGQTFQWNLRCLDTAVFLRNWKSSLPTFNLSQARGSCDGCSTGPQRPPWWGKESGHLTLGWNENQILASGLQLPSSSPLPPSGYLDYHF